MVGMALTVAERELLRSIMVTVRWSHDGADCLHTVMANAMVCLLDGAIGHGVDAVSFTPAMSVWIFAHMRVQRWSPSSLMSKLSTIGPN